MSIRLANTDSWPGLGLCLLAVAAFAFPPQNRQPEKFSLAFHPEAGTTLVYSLNNQVESEGRSILGLDLSLQARASGEIDLWVAQAAADHVVVNLTTPGIQVFLRVLDRLDEFMLKAQKENPVEMVINKTGRVGNIRNIEALEEQNLFNFSIMEVLQTYFPAFPERPVAEGESWTDHRQLTIPFQSMKLTVDIESTSTLVRVLPGPEGRSGVINAQYAVILSGRQQFEDTVAAVDGKGSGSGVLNLQIDRRSFTEYRLDFAVNGALTLHKAGAKLAEWPIRLSAFNGLSLVDSRVSPEVRPRSFGSVNPIK